MSKPPATVPLVQPVAEVVINELWRELKRIACEEALVRQLRHDKATRRHWFPKQFGPFGEER